MVLLFVVSQQVFALENTTDQSVKAPNSATLPALNQSSCEISQGADRVQSIVDFQSCEQSHNQVFPGYRSSDYPFVLVDLVKSPNLATVVQKGAILGTLTLELPIIVQNGLYEYQIPGDEHFNINPSLNDPLKKIGIKEALIWNIGMSMPFAGTPLESWPQMAFHFSLMAHEGFHFFGQRLQKIQTPWPTAYLGISEQSRNMMNDVCFNKDAQTVNFVSTERQAILDSFIAIQQNDIAVAKEKANQFITARKNRYTNLGDTKILDPVLPPRSCEVAENAASIIEGIPEYIGIGTLLNLRIISPEQSLAYFPIQDTAKYYRFPLFQALILTGGKSASILEALQRPENGVEAVLEHWIQIQ